MNDYLIPLSMIEELLLALGKTLTNEGEDFRLKHAELLDIYNALVDDAHHINKPPIILQDITSENKV